ncbi:hypothetical protein [Vibrio anguillarum]|uniref:hypothetical protein n=1 Tax=Vibrio anguillarum TaxID=55601 RepID=UPI0002D8675E|nr:hypothetical protein [Vibrio anguillarum]OEE42315.1 hypothetical protein A1QU_00635 [Vibrio anguillarum]
MQSDDLKTIKEFVGNLNIVIDKHPNVETHFWKGKYGDILAIVDVFASSSQCHITASGERCLTAARQKSSFLGQKNER